MNGALSVVTVLQCVWCGKKAQTLHREGGSSEVDNEQGQSLRQTVFGILIEALAHVAIVGCLEIRWYRRGVVAGFRMLRMQSVVRAYPLT